MAVVSLGCAKNLVDTEIMLGQLNEGGWELTSDFSEAELILVNTCGFVASAKEESVNNILEMAQYKEPGRGECRLLVVAGCLVQRYAKELSTEIPEVDYWIGLGQIAAINSLIKDLSLKQKPLTEGNPYLNNQNLPRYQVTKIHTTYVKIAEGCNHRCSYCAIPIIKGGFVSRDPEAIVNEVNVLVAKGVKEINLIAQDITMYGRDLLPATNLVSLLKALIARARPPWLRLLYAYPNGIEAELLRLIAREDSICKYLDLPIQHINDRVLKAMNRADTTSLIRQKLAQIRSLVPEIVLRTTLITGFPGESESEFAELLTFVDEARFEHLGVFTYSREEGTMANNLKPQVPENVKVQRQKRLLEKQRQIVRDFLTSQVGRETTVIIDRKLPDGTGVGRSQGFAPESDGVILINNLSGREGQFIKAQITGCDDYNLFAKEI